MLEFLIDTILAIFGVFQHTVGIPMGTNCAPLVADLFLYSYEAYFFFFQYNSCFTHHNYFWFSDINDFPYLIFANATLSVDYV